MEPQTQTSASRQPPNKPPLVATAAPAEEPEPHKVAASIILTTLVGPGANLLSTINTATQFYVPKT